MNVMREVVERLETLVADLDTAFIRPTKSDASITWVSKERLDRWKRDLKLSIKQLRGSP